jgi:hypothetical protein
MMSHERPNYPLEHLLTPLRNLFAGRAYNEHNYELAYTLLREYCRREVLKTDPYNNQIKERKPFEYKSSIGGFIHYRPSLPYEILICPLEDDGKYIKKGGALKFFYAQPELTPYETRRGTIFYKITDTPYSKRTSEQEHVLTYIVKIARHAAMPIDMKFEFCEMGYGPVRAIYEGLYKESGTIKFGKLSRVETPLGPAFINYVDPRGVLRYDKLYYRSNKKNQEISRQGSDFFGTPVEYFDGKNLINLEHTREHYSKSFFKT